MSTASLSESTKPSGDAEKLAVLVGELQELHAADIARISKLERDCAEYQKLVRLLQEANEKLKRGLLGQKAERLPNDAQLSLAILNMALGNQAGSSAENTTDEPKQKVAEHERRKPVRNPLPEHLPRVPIEVLPEEVKRQGLDAFDRIGVETREVLERRPASVVVVEVSYPKFVLKGETTIDQGEDVSAQSEPEWAAQQSDISAPDPVDDTNTGLTDTASASSVEQSAEVACESDLVESPQPLDTADTPQGPACTDTLAMSPAPVASEPGHADSNEEGPSSTSVQSSPLSDPGFAPQNRPVLTPGQRVYMASALELPIERGLAGPGFLAQTIVYRWWDHQPLNRQQGIYAREGLNIAKSTLCGWHETLADLAEPLYEAMFRDAFGCPYLCVDATGILVLAKERCKKGHFWVLVAPEKHVLFRFSHRHDSAAVDDLLSGYTGYLVADAHAVYDHLFEDGTVVEVACWCHARRYYHKALESDPERAKEALAMIAALFRIERTIADAPRKKKEAVRLEKSKPIVDRFLAWCEAQRDVVLDESPISKAVNYSYNQRDALRRFLDDGRLPMHNNISELNLRRPIVGRHNWLFVGSEDGAKANTIFVSLLASCALHGIEPLGYLRDLFILLPSWPKSRVLELAPAYWKQTLEQSEAQQKLAANVFRRVVLGLPV